LNEYRAKPAYIYFTFPQLAVAEFSFVGDTFSVRGAMLRTHPIFRCPYALRLRPSYRQTRIDDGSLYSLKQSHFQELLRLDASASAAALSAQSIPGVRNEDGSLKALRRIIWSLLLAGSCAIYFAVAGGCQGSGLFASATAAAGARPSPFRLFTTCGLWREFK
jgi:hypothetical protein